MNDRIAGWVIGIGLLLFLAYIVIVSYQQASELQESHKTTVGVIKFLGKNAGGASVSPEYEYYVDGNQYYGFFSKKAICEDVALGDRKRLVGKSITVIYDPNNIENSTALLSPQDYVRYGVSIPDSLRGRVSKYFSCN